MAIGLPPDEPARQRRARPWRLLTAGGGLLLAAAFFMPGVPGCNEAIAPAGKAYHEFCEVFANPTPGPFAALELLFSFCIRVYLFYVFAYLFGLFLAIRTIRSLASSHLHSRPYASAALLALACFTVLVALILLVTLDPWAASQWATSLIIGLLALVVLVYTLRALWSFGPRAHLGVAFLGSLAAAIWFGCWAIPGYYGVRLSTAGSVMMLVGTIGEAHVLTRRSWPGTIWRLLSCRLRNLPLPDGTCPGCDYHLFGLRDTRCPECGREFTFEELGVTPEQLGFTVAAPCPDP